MDIFVLLTEEWSTLAYTRATTVHYQRWQEDEPQFLRWPSLDALIRFAQRRGDPAASDQALALLACRCSADELAARALLQALLPGLRAIVVQHHWLTDYEELTTSTVTLAWERIRTYPFANRPGRIAANVLRDTAHRLRRAHRWEQAATTRIDVAVLQSEDSSYRMIDLFDLVHRHLDHDGLALVLRTRIGGEKVASVAAELGCSPAALRERRRRSEEKLRSALTPSTSDRRVAS